MRGTVLVEEPARLRSTGCSVLEADAETNGEANGEPHSQADFRLDGTEPTNRAENRVASVVSKALLKRWRVIDSGPEACGDGIDGTWSEQKEDSRQAKTSR